MRRRWMLFAPIAILLFIAIGGALVELLWNALLPAIFGVRAITFWQAVGLLALCRILFGGLGRHGGYRPGWGFRRRMRARWEAMTPEERERFRDGMRAGCGFGPAPSASKPDERAVGS